MRQKFIIYESSSYDRSRYLKAVDNWNKTLESQFTGSPNREYLIVRI